MQFKLNHQPSFNDTDCLVIGLFQSKNMPEFVANLPQAHQDLIHQLSQQLTEKDDLVWQSNVEEGRQLLLVHCGEEKDYASDVLNESIATVIKTVLKKPIKNVALSFPKLSDKEADWQLKHMVLQAQACCYELHEYKSKKPTPRALECMTFVMSDCSEKTIEHGVAIGAGEALAKDLANAPANICTPTYLAEKATQLGKQYSAVQTRILKASKMRRMGMGALLAVGQGSDEEPKLIEMQYRGGDKNAEPIIFVGKGITFDSGGISLKPAEGMNEMKYDMGGAASVFGVIKACAELKLPINVIGLVAAAENMPSGKAVKPGDIVTSMAGKTIEITNTDAEGRLVLADALTYAEQFKPKFVIDIATLTGAVIIALGHAYTGLMTRDEGLADLITAAAQESADKTWRLPLDESYEKALYSPIADMINASFDRSAGSITAGCFLSRFTKAYRWAHLDIAGTAWISGKERNATGRPVRLLVEFLNHANRTG